MSQEMVRKVAKLTKSSEATTREHLRKNQHAWAHAISMCLALPGLRGFWPMSGFDSAGNATDFGNLGHHMQYQGDPEYSLDNLAPYIHFDGAGDYLSVADHADYDILGTEAYVAAAARGVSVGGWFRPENNNGSFMIGKLAAAGTYSYWLQQSPAPGSAFGVSVDGTVLGSAEVVGATLALNTWQFVAGSFDPSTIVTLFVNDIVTTNAVAIPASVFNSATSLTIGGNSLGGLLFTGRASLCFVCAAFVPSATILALFHQTRAMFGV